MHNKLKTQPRIYDINYNWKNWLNLRHTLDRPCYNNSAALWMASQFYRYLSQGPCVTLPGAYPFNKSLQANDPNLKGFVLLLCIHYYQTRPHLCTCHDSSAVVACAKLWHDYMIKNKIRANAFSQNSDFELINRLWNGSHTLEEVALIWGTASERTHIKPSMRWAPPPYND